MPQSAIITRPFYDPTTSYLHRWNLSVVKYARTVLKSVADLDEKNANRKNLESYIKKLKPELIILNGHGSEDSVLGQGGDILIKVGENEYILKGSVVFSLSCSSAKVLGPASTKKGAKAYIGYTQDFIFAYTDGYFTKAEQDPLAKLFLEPTNKIATSLIAGNSPKDSHQKGLKFFQKNLEKVLLSNSSEEYVARFLIWDMIHQTCLS